MGSFVHFYMNLNIILGHNQEIVYFYDPKKLIFPGPIVGSSVHFINEFE